MDNAALEPLTHLADGIGVDNVSLFIGGQFGASDDKLLRQHKIINVLNCAVNCDINYVDETLDLTPGGANRVFGYAPVRTAKSSHCVTRPAPDTYVESEIFPGSAG